VTRGQLPHRAGSLGLSSGGAAAAVPQGSTNMRWVKIASFSSPKITAFASIVLAK